MKNLLRSLFGTQPAPVARIRPTFAQWHAEVAALLRTAGWNIANCGEWGFEIAWQQGESAQDAAAEFLANTCTSEEYRALCCAAGQLV